jgi:hypothetical protein
MGDFMKKLLLVSLLVSLSAANAMQEPVSTEGSDSSKGVWNYIKGIPGNVWGSQLLNPIHRDENSTYKPVLKTVGHLGLYLVAYKMLPKRFRFAGKLWNKITGSKGAVETKKIGVAQFEDMFLNNKKARLNDTQGIAIAQHKPFVITPNQQEILTAANLVFDPTLA